jgi:hypothetical protein
MDYAKVTARLSYFAESLSRMFGKGADELPIPQMPKALQAPKDEDPNSKE